MGDEKFENGYALIIGTASDPNIIATAQDAQQISHTIKYHSYYPHNQIVTLTGENATKKNIINGFKWLIDASEKNDEITVFIYYAGHGFPPSKKANGCTEFHLFPNDGDLEQNETIIAASEIAPLFKQIRAQKLVWFLNACHSAGFSESSFSLGQKGNELSEEDRLNLQKEMSLGTNSFINELSYGEGRVIISAAQADAKAYIPMQSGQEKTNTIFGQVLIEALQGAANVNEKLIELSTLYDYILRTVKKKSAYINQEQIASFRGNMESFPVAINPRYVALQSSLQLFHIDISKLQLHILEEVLNKSTVENTYGFRIGATQIEADWDHTTFLENCRLELRNHESQTSYELKSALKELTGVFLFRLLDEKDQKGLFEVIQSNLKFRFILDFQGLPKLYEKTIITFPWEQMRIPANHFHGEFPKTNLLVKKSGIFSRRVKSNGPALNPTPQRQVNRLKILFIDNSASQNLTAALSEHFDYNFEQGTYILDNRIEISILDLSSFRKLTSVTLKEAMNDRPNILHYFGPIGYENDNIFLPFKSDWDEKDNMYFSTKKMDDSHPFNWILADYENYPTIVTLHADERSTNQFPDKYDIAALKLSSYGIPSVAFLPPHKNGHLMDLISRLYPIEIQPSERGYIYNFSEYYAKTDAYYQYASNEFEPILYCITDEVVEIFVQMEVQHKKVAGNSNAPPKQMSNSINIRKEDEFSNKSSDMKFNTESNKGQLG